MYAVTTEAPSVGAVELSTGSDEARLDSRVLAERLGVLHQNLFELLKKHRADFDQLGKVRFETGASSSSRTGQRVRFARLNEDQCYLMLTYSRNSPRVRQFKVDLVKAFRDARSIVELHKVEYLPGYHQLHDGIQALAGGSPNERFVHQNVNKLVNRAAGLEAGQRATVPVRQRAMLILAQDLAAQAMRGAHDHHDGFQRAKQALQQLVNLTQLPATDAGPHHGQ